MGDPKIQTELAAFLVVAGEYSYYRCGAWGHTDAPWYKVYDMPLGKPLANATLANGVYKRSFASGTKVTFDTKTKTGTMDWAEREILSSSELPPELSFDLAMSVSALRLLRF